MDTLTRKRPAKKSILRYVKQHIDADGFYTGDNLPRGDYSFINPIIGFELGAGDAFFLTSRETEDTEITDTVAKAITAFVQDPSGKNKESLSQLLSFTQCISCCETITEKLSAQPLPGILVNLALEWLYQTANRETVKFALLICGIYGLNRLTDERQPSLKQDLRALAVCDEFTYFVIRAFQLSNLFSELNLWQLIHRTYGWGRVHAMQKLSYTTEEEKNWLLRHGSEIDVNYPAIALLCIKQGNMMQTLQQKSLDEELYRGILNTLNNYLEYLQDFEESPDELPPPGMFNNFGLFQAILHHADAFSDSIENLIGVINFAHGLTSIAEDANWHSLSPNQCHLLISQAERLIYSRDWRPEVEEKLLNENGSINYLAIDFAEALNIDTWEPLFALLQAHPTATKLFTYLLSTEDEERLQKILQLARKNLKKYCDNDYALPPIINALQLHPGKGEDILAAALTSLYDWPRSCALDTLDAWGLEYLTPDFRAALFKALDLAQHTLLTLRIKALLDNRIFNLEGVVKIMTME